MPPFKIVLIATLIDPVGGNTIAIKEIPFDFPCFENARLLSGDKPVDLNRGIHIVTTARCVEDNGRALPPPPPPRGYIPAPGVYKD